MDCYKFIQDEKVTLHLMPDNGFVHFSVFYGDDLFKKRRITIEEARDYWNLFKKNRYPLTKIKVSKNFLGYCQFED